MVEEELEIWFAENPGELFNKFASICQHAFLLNPYVCLGGKRQY